MSRIDTIAPAGPGVLPRVDLNWERREERTRILVRSRRWLGALATLLVLGPVFLVPLTTQAILLGTERAHFETQIADVQTRLGAVSSASDRVEAQLGLWTRFSESQDNRQAWEGMLPALAAALPSDASLSQVQISRGADGLRIAAQGSSETMGGVRSFLAALATSRNFARVRLTETTSDPAQGPRGVDFKLDGPVDHVPAGAGE